jgi:hypothetical protein
VEENVLLGLANDFNSTAIADLQLARVGQRLDKPAEGFEHP